MPPVTIRDVAKRAGVGVGTVSRVLNGNLAVSADTRQRVVQAITDLDFSPNPIARRLSARRTQTIAVTLPFLTYASFVERVRGVQHALVGTSYDLLLRGTDPATLPDDYYSDLARTSRADGILVISVPLGETHVARLLESRVPTVLVGISDARLSRVVVDEAEGGRLATQHLLDLGHRRIAYLSDWFGSDSRYAAARERFLGYRSALKAAGVALEPRLERQINHSRGAGRDAVLSLMQAANPPTAIFAASDTQAIGALDAARLTGRRVPEDLSIVGYDDIRDAEYVGLTTIRQPLYQSGLVSATLLLELIANPPGGPKEVMLPIELVVRTTSGPCRVGGAP